MVGHKVTCHALAASTIMCFGEGHSINDIIICYQSITDIIVFKKDNP